MNVTVTAGHSVLYKKQTYLPGQVIAMDEKEALRLLAKKNPPVAAADSEGIIAASPPLEKMSAAKLKQLLDKLKVEYPADAKKEDLMALVLANTAAPPQEE